MALESCANAFAFHRLLCQHAGKVVVSNPLKTRVIAEAKVKTDKVDAEILAAEKALPEEVHQDELIRRLLTIPGIALTSAVGLKAAIGDIRRFRAPANLVSYFVSTRRSTTPDSKPIPDASLVGGAPTPARYASKLPISSSGSPVPSTLSFSV